MGEGAKLLVSCHMTSHMASHMTFISPESIFAAADRRFGGGPIGGAVIEQKASFYNDIYWLMPIVDKVNGLLATALATRHWEEAGRSGTRSKIRTAALRGEGWRIKEGKEEWKKIQYYKDN